MYGAKEIAKFFQKKGVDVAGLVGKVENVIRACSSSSRRIGSSTESRMLHDTQVQESFSQEIFMEQKSIEKCDVLFSRTISRDSTRNASRLGSKNGIDDTTVSIQEEVSCDMRKRNSIFIKEAREDMKMSVRLGVKFHGRESYNIKKMLELKGIEISEQEIKAEVKALDILEGDSSSSVVF